MDYVDEIIIESLYEIIEYNLNYLLEESDPTLNKRPIGLDGGTTPRGVPSN